MADKNDIEQNENIFDGDPRYPQGEAANVQVKGRQRRGNFWRTAFVASTLVGIIALLALLYNIINSSVGYVAMQNKIDPEDVVLAVQEEKMLTSENLLSSEDDVVLAEEIVGNPNAIGFFGYAYYQERADVLRALPVDGVEPNIASVDSGEYPLARPLFLYTSESVLKEKPQIGAFIDRYLTDVGAQIEDVGYFPTSEEALSTARETLNFALDGAASGASSEGDILIAGSSTVFPLSQRMAEGFQDSGFAGVIEIESIGSTAGISRFCDRKGAVDIANASRAMRRSEVDACRQAKRTPLEFRVGTDAIAVVVSQENDFLKNVTQDELRQLFTSAATWSEVNAEWPNTPIERYIPGADSGTLDFFTEQIFSESLSDLPKETLWEILVANVRAGVIRRFERERPLADRSQEDVLALVLERVIKPEVVQTWTLSDSLLNRTEIEQKVASIEYGTLEFRSWITPEFITSPQSSNAEEAGIRTAILGSLWVILITVLFSLPLGVGAAIYLEEYAEEGWLNRLIETNINNLAGVPSIIYGMLGLAIFVRALEAMTSGALFGGLDDPSTANGRTVLSAGLTLGLLILPIIIINAREAIRAVPSSLRQASYGLGATKWQTIWNHVIPSALPGILTGNILAMSRAIGETAPLVVIGASTFILVDPSSPFSKFTTLPIQIYQWTARPQAEFRNIAAAAIVVLLLMLLTLNASAVLLRSRYSN